MNRRALMIALLSCTGSLARADVQTFVNDYAGFAAASGPLSLIDFETQPNGMPSQGGVPITSTYNYDAYGVHFSAANITPILAGNPDTGFDLSAMMPLPLPGYRTWIIADPLAPAYSVGAHFAGHSYLFAYDESGQLIAQGFAGGTPGQQFLGIVSDSPIDFVIFDRLSFLASIDALHFSPIPEPATALLLAWGLIPRPRTRRHE